MSEPIWNKFLTERDKAVFGRLGLWCTRRLWQAAGASGDRRELGVLRRSVGTDTQLDQALAQFLRRGCLGGAALYPRA